MPRSSTARTSASETALDKMRVSTAEGALPVHTRIEVLHATKGWEQGLITESFARLDGKAQVIVYKVAFDSGKEQEVELRDFEAIKLVTTHSADTPRSQRKSSHTDVRAAAAAAAAAPKVGVTNIPSPSKLNGMKLPELRKVCQDLGLESKGQKKVLISLISRAHSAAAAMLSGDLIASPSATAGAARAARAAAGRAREEWHLA